MNELSASMPCFYPKTKDKVTCVQASVHFLTLELNGYVSKQFYICFVAVLCRVSCFDLYCGFIRQRPYTRLKGGIWYAFLFYIYFAFCRGDLLFQLVMHAKMPLIKIFLTAVIFRLAPDFLLPHFLKVSSSVCTWDCFPGTKVARM